MQRKTKALDLTQGSIWKLLLLFALPLCLGNVLQQLYSTVDTLVISNFCGTTSLAAVGTSSQPIEILMCVFMGIGAGMSILVAQYVGAKDIPHLKLAVSNATTFVYVCAVPVTILGYLLGPVMLRLMQVPADTMPAATDYICIMFIGTMGNLGFNTNAGILRGLGDSRSSLWFLLISCCVNILLDILFVAGMGMDVAGAALATIIAQYVSWLVSAIYLRSRFPELQFSLRPRKMDTNMLKSILRIGLPLGLNHSIYSIGHIVLQLLINTQGASFMAACSVASKINSIANVAISSLASAATTFSGQNLGAGRYDRLKQGAWQIPVFSGVLSLVTGCIVAVFAPQILQIFHPEPDVIELAVLYIRIVCPLFWTYAVFNAILSFVNGTGNVRYATIVNILMLWVVRIPVAFLIVNWIDGRYVMAAYPISFTVGMIAMFCYFFSPAWRSILQKAALQSPSAK